MTFLGPYLSIRGALIKSAKNEAAVEIKKATPN